MFAHEGDRAVLLVRDNDYFFVLYKIQEKATWNGSSMDDPSETPRTPIDNEQYARLLEIERSTEADKGRWEKLFAATGREHWSRTLGSNYVGF